MILKHFHTKTGVFSNIKWLCLKTKLFYLVRIKKHISNFFFHRLSLHFKKIILILRYISKIICICLKYIGTGQKFIFLINEIKYDSNILSQLMNNIAWSWFYFVHDIFCRKSSEFGWNEWYFYIPSFQLRYIIELEKHIQWQIYANH